MRQKTRILVYILIAIAAVIMGTLTILNNHQADKPASAQEHIDLGRIYLTELSYEKAVLEFTEAIEIEPLNADAYLGLAESYAGMGDVEKAIEILEEGYGKTGDGRLKYKLYEPTFLGETTVAATTVTTTAATTISTIEMIIVPDLSGLQIEDAVSMCENIGLLYEIKTSESDNIEKEYVISQSVPAGNSVPVNYSITINISNSINTVNTVSAHTAPVEEFITIKGVQYSTNLVKLELINMNLTNEDIKNLYKMTNLTELNLSFNQINNISVLHSLSNLTKLDLRDNQINDIDALDSLTCLTWLNLINNQISDISALKNLTSLTVLGLGQNQIRNISELKQLSNLEILYLFDNPISDISVSKNLINLEGLHLDYDQINDINILKNLTNLNILYLYDDHINYDDILELEKELRCSIVTTPNCTINY